MKRIYLFAFMAIMVLGSMYSGLSAYSRRSLEEFESLHLAYAIDQASDAAAYKMIDTDNINSDYADMDSIQVNPQVAIDTFLDTLAFNYGMRPNKENRALLMNKYVPSFTVAGYDGFWIAQPAISYDNDKVELTMVFTPKLPYRVSQTVGDETTYYALNMGSQSAIKLNSKTKTFTRVDVSKLKVSKSTAKNPDLSNYDTRQALINKSLTNAIGASIDANVDKEKWSNTFFLPGNLTKYTSVNPVSGPSIIALVENVDLLTGRKASAFSITGSKVTSSRPLIGYTKKDTNTGKVNKFYSYSDKLLNKKGYPLYPFLQFDKEAQRYKWTEFPQYKYTACYDKVDFEKLRNDSSYILPSIDTSNNSVIDYAAIIANDHTEITLQEVFRSKKEAAENGYMYDMVPMRTVAKDN